MVVSSALVAQEPWAAPNHSLINSDAQRRAHVPKFQTEIKICGGECGG